VLHCGFGRFLFDTKSSADLQRYSVTCMVTPWDGPLPRAVLTPPNCKLAQRLLGQPPVASSSSLPDSSADGTSTSQAAPAAVPFGTLRATPTSPPPAEDYLYEPQTAEDLLPDEDYATAYGSEDMEDPAEDADPSPGSPSMDAQASRPANTYTEDASLVAHVSFLEHKVLQLEAERAADKAQIAADKAKVDQAVDLLSGNKRSQSQTRQQQDKRTRGSDPTRGRPSASQPPSTHSRDTIPARQVERGDKEFTIVKEGQANSTFRRSKQIANFCMARHICAHCFRSGHSPNHCRSAKAQGYPQGFDPNYVPPNRQ